MMTGESRRSRKRASFVRQTGEGKAQTCAVGMFTSTRRRQPLYWQAMNPKYKRAFLVVALVWMAPYLGFVGYYSLQFPLGHWPSWLTFTAILWLIADAAGITLLMLAIKKMFPK
jgi:hypothetical protein